jgi:hypothetical protein
MTDIAQNKHRNFSQRNGYEKIDDVLQIDSMSDALRTTLYNFVWENYYHGNWEGNATYFGIKREILYSEFFKEPLNDIPATGLPEEEKFNEWFYNCKWNKIYDFFEFCFEKIEGKCNKGNYYEYDDYRRECETFCKKLNSLLERENSGYRMIKGLISPITDDLEIGEIKEAFDEDDKGRKEHLTKAIEFLRCHNEQKADYRNSIKESISALEAIVRKLTGERTLGDGLKELEKNGVKINSCLKDAFIKLYGYTNDKNGIRHAIMSDENVSLGEAKFMLVAVSAFINYIAFLQSKD